MSEIDPAKLQAAQAAAALVCDGMAVGLGSGTTATLVIEQLGRRVRQEGLNFVGVATSEATARLARQEGIPLRDLDDFEALDLDIDGADEVDPQFRLIKGRGGALLREKIVAMASRQRAIVITPSKRVQRLGERFPVPIEASPFGLRHTDRQLKALGCETTIRRGEDGSAMVTDSGHRIIDCRFARIDDPEAIDQSLRKVVGVFETGLFLGLCELLVVGHPERAELVHRPPG